MTETELAELRRLDADGSPRPWNVDIQNGVRRADGMVVLRGWHDDTGDAALTVAAVNALPRLLDEVERLKEIKRRWKEAGS